MGHMEECLVCQHHESGHESITILVLVLSWESMLASLDLGALEIYNRADIIWLLWEHGTPQASVWIDREVEFSDYGHDNMTINILRPKVYSFVVTEILDMRPSELCDAVFCAFLSYGDGVYE